MAEELIKYMAEEVAMDGSLGCSPRRFIYLLGQDTSPIHVRPSNAPPLTPELIRKTAAYVWRQLAQLEGYRVVNLREVQKRLVDATNLLAAVSKIDPDRRRSKPKGGKNKEEAGAEVPAVDDDDDPVMELCRALNPPRIRGLNNRPKEALLEKAYEDSQVGQDERGDMNRLEEVWGEEVCMAAAPEEIRLALTGTRLPNPRFSMTICSALEMVARSRAAGVHMVDIGARSSNSKSKAKRFVQTAFYVVKILVEAGLVVKLKGMEVNRTASNIVHAKYLEQNRNFIARKPYLSVRGGAEAGQSERDLTEMETLGSTVLAIDERTRLPIFPKFGRSELRVKPFMKARLITLLRSELWHHLIENRELLMTLGFDNHPTKPDQRLFQRFVVRFITEGLLERVSVPSTYKSIPHYCLRLTEFRPTQDERLEEQKMSEHASARLGMHGESHEDDDAEAEAEANALVEEGLAENDSIPYIMFDHTVTREYEVLETIRQSGTRGQNFEQLAETLAMDKKVLEQVCARFETIKYGYPNLSQYNLYETAERLQRLNQVRWLTTLEYLEHCKQIDVDPFLGPGEKEAITEIGKFREIGDLVFYENWEGYVAALAQCPVPRVLGMAKNKKSARNEDVSLIRGRPRKWVKVLDLNRVLQKKIKAIELAVSKNLPETLLWNKDTKLLFPIPDQQLNAIGPIEPPEGWDDPTGGGVGKSRAHWLAISEGLDLPPTDAPQGVITSAEVKMEKVKKPRKSKKRAREITGEPEATDVKTDLSAPVLITEGDVPVDQPPKKKPRATKAGRQPRSTLKKNDGGKNRQDEVVPAVVAIDPLLDGVARSLPDNQVDIQQSAVRLDNDLVARPMSSGPTTSHEQPIAPLAPERQLTSPDKASFVPVAVDTVVPDIGVDGPEVTDPPAQSSQIETAPVAGKKSEQQLEVAVLKAQRKRIRIDHAYEMQIREILRYVAESGGIVLGGNFLISNMELWARTAQFGNGMPERAIQTRMASRTIKSVIHKLIEAKRISGSRVALPGLSAADRMCQVLWLPDIPEEQVAGYIKEISRVGLPRPTCKIEAIPTHVAGFSKPAERLRGPSLRQIQELRGDVTTWKTTPEQLHALEPEEMRAAFRQDWRLWPQVYGWQPALGRRLEMFHQILYEAGRKNGHSAQGGVCVAREELLLQLDVATTCEIFPVVDSDEALEDLIRSGAARHTKIQDLGADLQNVVSTIRGRMKAKVTRLISTLVEMGLVETRQRFVDDASGAAESTGFYPAPVEEATYLLIADSVPIVDWSRQGDSSNTTGSLVATMPLVTKEDIATYWYLTWYLAVSKENSAAKATHVQTRLGAISSQIQKPLATFKPSTTSTLNWQLGQARAWRLGFVLSEVQRRYLQWLVQNQELPDDFAQIQYRGQLEEIAYRLFAPVEPTERYLNNCLGHQRKRRQTAALKEKIREEDHVLREAIKRKIEERQVRREQSWQDLVAKACTRSGCENNERLNEYLQAFHKRYLRDPESFNTTQFYEVVSNFLSGLQRRNGLDSQLGHSMFISNVTPVTKAPRQRTHWTPPMEELARDAFIVINHRQKLVPSDATTKATVTTAWGKVFPHVAPYKIRRRVNEWMSESASNAEFMKHLALEWENIYATLQPDELSDPDPTSLEHFDVLMHISILRQNVKKNALLQRARDPEEGDAEYLQPLSNDLVALETTFAAEESMLAGGYNGFHHFWSTRSSEMAKERDVNSQSALLSLGGTGTRVNASKEDALLESAAKLIVSTPAAGYREDQADILLQNFTTQRVDRKFRRMIKDGVLAKSGQRAVTGRGFRYNEAYQSFKDSPIESQVYEDSKGMKNLGADEIMKWNPICQPGEVAGYLEMMSAGKLTAGFDSHAVDEILEGWAISWGATRRIDDEDIELDVVFRKADSVLPKILSGDTSDVVPMEKLEDEMMIVDEVTERVREAILETGPNGIVPADLAGMLDIEFPAVMIILVDLAKSGEIDCLGWDHGRVVHRDHLAGWNLTFGSREAPPPTIKHGVLVPNRADKHERRIAYQWLDIYGEHNEKEWQLALNAVFGHIVMRPGINENVLRSQLAKLFSRHELNRLVQHLINSAHLQRFCGDRAIESRLGLAVVGLASQEDERYITYLADGIMTYV